MNYKELKCEECCFTCKNNVNSFVEDFSCNCILNKQETSLSQDCWCEDYEIHEDYESK